MPKKIKEKKRISVGERKTPFAKWAAAHELDVDGVRKRFNLSRSYAYALLTGRATPGWKTRALIAKETRDAVAVDSWG
jgi:hypothetical protein